MNRKISREKSMELLFGMSISKETPDEVMETFIDNYEKDITKLDLEYIKNILDGVNKNQADIDSLIEKNLNSWKLDRISKINLTILRIGVFEIKFDEDIPDRVALNEALELAKKYSDEKSVAFINGVLDKVLNNN